MQLLSVVIITHNEEHNLERCLASVQQVADEIVVLDSGSDDRTVDIANEFGAIVQVQAFAGYVEQKNDAVALATNEYVLALDADEALSEELMQSILKEKQADFPNDAYAMNRLNNYCGQWIRHGDYYPDRKLRLWKKAVGHWGGDNPHDKVVVQPGTAVQLLKGDILHYSFRTPEEHRRQMELFSTIAANTMFEKGKKNKWTKKFFSPAWSFFRGYILRSGWKDGAAGWRIAKMNAWYTREKYRKLGEREK